MVDIEATGKQYLAEGNCARAVAGRWFALSGHYSYSGDDAQFLIVEVEHEASNNYLQATGEPAQYKNRIICQPKATPWQPGLEYNSTDTRIYATQTATVVDQYQVKLFNGTVHDLPVAADQLQKDSSHPYFLEHQLSNKGIRADGMTSAERLAQSLRGAE